MKSDEVAVLRAVPDVEPQLPVPSGRSSTGSRRRLLGRVLVLADASGLFVAFAITALLFGTERGRPLALGAQYALFALTLPGWTLLAKLYELYDRDEERTEHSTLDDIVGVLHFVTVGSWVLFIGARLTGAANPDPLKAATFWLLALAFVTVARSAGRTYCRRRASFTQNALIVGAGEIGQLIARKLQQHPEYGITVVGFADNDPLDRRSDLAVSDVLGGPGDLAELVQRYDVSRVIVAFSNDPANDLVDAVRTLKRLEVQVDIVPRLFDAVGPNVFVHSVEGLPLLGLPSSKRLPYSFAIKRGLDLVGASILLVLTSPIFLFAAWRVHRDSPGPIFFRQTRLGEGMGEFTALKFRTMEVHDDDTVHRDFIRDTMSATATTTTGVYKLERADLVTTSGRWLRRTSLDELPQLLNVLRGDMSLVGPRPCLRYETEHFAPHHFERFTVPAGLTGLWQVTARARSTFGEALDMDVAYARNWSLGLDLWLLLRTPFVMLRSKATA